MTPNKRRPVPWNPSEEGKTHLNIYSRSQKVAGQFASNFKAAPFVAEWEPGQPYFQSVEAYWYWLLVDRDDTLSNQNDLDSLMSTSGYAAKKSGQLMLELYGRRTVPDFQDRIKKPLLPNTQQMCHSSACSPKPSACL